MPRINYKPANIRGLGTDFQLKPGWNDVPDEVWSRWEKDGEVRALSEQGLLEVEGEEPAPAPKRRAPKPPPAPKVATKVAPPVEDDESELSDAELEQLAAETAAK